MVKGFTVKVKLKMAHEAKMSPEELHNYLNMARTGSSKTKNGRAYSRKRKHKNKHTDYWKD